MRFRVEPSLKVPVVVKRVTSPRMTFRNFGCTSRLTSIGVGVAVGVGVTVGVAVGAVEVAVGVALTVGVGGKATVMTVLPSHPLSSELTPVVGSVALMLVVPGPTTSTRLFWPVSLGARATPVLLDA